MFAKAYADGLTLAPEAVTVTDVECAPASAAAGAAGSSSGAGAPAPSAPAAAVAPSRRRQRRRRALLQVTLAPPPSPPAAGDGGPVKISTQFSVEVPKGERARVGFRLELESSRSRGPLLPGDRSITSATHPASARMHASY